MEGFEPAVVGLAALVAPAGDNLHGHFVCISRRCCHSSWGIGEL